MAGSRRSVSTRAKRGEAALALWNNALVAKMVDGVERGKRKGNCDTPRCVRGRPYIASVMEVEVDRSPLRV